MNPESVDYLSGNGYICFGKIQPMQKKLVYVETYGCQMNVADSEVVLSIMNDGGFGITEGPGVPTLFLSTHAVFGITLSNVFANGSAR